MELAFLGATRTVTGSCFLVSVGDRRVMIDCGLNQGLPELEERNYTHPSVDWAEVDAILLTHAHIDHCGLIPRAVKLGFKGPIYAHAATVDLAEIMLRDSSELHEKEAEWLSRKRIRAGKAPVEPLYTKADVDECLKRFSGVEYEKRFQVIPGVDAEFRDEGHILGSAAIALDCVEGDLGRRIVFSGDVGHHQAPILREPQGFERADAALLETTYGNRVHETPADRWTRLRKIIVQAQSDQGKVVIPAFTVGRTQELLYILGDMLKKDEIPRIPIFLDSPMAIAATNVHERHPECFDRETLDRIKQGDNPFHPETVRFSQTVEESMKINAFKGSAVIIAGGGMCQGGRIVHHLKHTIFDRRNQLVFVGYQVEGTLGRLILNGVKRIKLFGEEIAVNARISAIGAFSAHADKNGLVDWLRHFPQPPKVVFLVHGEERVSEQFASTVREELGYVPYMPRLGQRVDLDRLDDLALGTRRFVQPATPKPGDVREIVARVGMLGAEFQSTVESYVGELGRRVKVAQTGGQEPHWRTQDAAEILTHMAEAVGGDIDKLEKLIESSKPSDEAGQE